MNDSNSWIYVNDIEILKDGDYIMYVNKSNINKVGYGVILHIQQDKIRPLTETFIKIKSINTPNRIFILKIHKYFLYYKPHKHKTTQSDIIRDFIKEYINNK